MTVDRCHHHISVTVLAEAGNEKVFMITLFLHVCIVFTHEVNY